MKKLILFLLFFSTNAFAENYPFDAISLHGEFVANAVYQQILPAPPSDRTILFIGMNMSGNPTQFELFCGSGATAVSILESHTNPPLLSYPVQVHCNQALTGTVTGGASPWGHFYLVYVDRDTRLSGDLGHIVVILSVVFLFTFGFNVGRGFTKPQGIGA